MLTAIRHSLRLARAMLILARHDAFGPTEQFADLPASARQLMGAAKMASRIALRRRDDKGLAAAITELGPSYIKLGQFLATRPDIVGAAHADELASLRDRLPPFSREEALAEIRSGLGAEPDTLFSEFGEPVAAASIAQVHRARTIPRDGEEDKPRDVAVKILRPGIEERFSSDLDSFFFAARLAERVQPAVHRLRPLEAVETLAQSVRLEMDLRMEAAAISEMAANTADDAGFRVPDVDWTRTSRRVLTTEWVEATPLGDIEALKAQGHDLEALADTVMQSFLRHAIRDGFFHADMHQGNLFVDPDGTIVAVDFGIMGRLGLKERRFLAEILWGFTTRNYMRVSEVHFEAGYVPGDQSPAVFAQALRAIGEPLLDRSADEISMARLLGQLFYVTEQFNMHTQPQLLLLQKTMVVVEGVARTLNPRLNMWETAGPVLRDWVEHTLGPEGRIHEAAEGAATLGRLVTGLPELLTEAERTTHMLADMAKSGGIRLDAATTEELAAAQARHGWASRLALWIGALALVAIALVELF